MPSFRFRILVAIAAIALAGCLAREKHEKPLTVGAMVPPWDPAKFSPKHLEGFTFADTTGTFAVFDTIARMDSLAGDPKTWTTEAAPIDSLRIGHMLDTGFMFPQYPEAIMPYGYDDSFRDDTLYRQSFGNGLFTQDHPCATNFVLTGNFLHPARWLKKGLRVEDIKTALGSPLYAQPGILRYLSKRAGPRPETNPEDTLSTAADYSVFDIFEGVNLYFKEDSLFAAVLQKSQPCH
jgi:hypothetical protein